MSLKRSVASMLYKTTRRVLVDPDRFNIVPIVPSPRQEQQAISRELSEAEYRELSAEDDYHGETVTRFRVARALLYASSDQLVVVEPGLLLLAIMIERFGRPVSILEFGGGTGYHYTTLNRIMPGAIQRYTIIETAAQVKATHGRIPFIDFSSDIPTGSFDIVFSSGALQCTDRPSDYLDALCALGAPVMIFTRNAFSDRPTFFEQRSRLFDHGGGSIPDGFENILTRLYVRTLNEHDFMKRFASYEIVSKIRNDNGIVAGLNAYGFDYVFKLPRENRTTR